MPNDFENRQKELILNQIEDPYQKDIANIGLTATDCLKQVACAGVAGACFTGCAALFEVGDHSMALLCYIGCSAWAGAVSYRGFRRVWQGYSIPFKNYLLSFFRR
jgi:hypothetical protein